MCCFQKKQPKWQENPKVGNFIGIYLGIFGDLCCYQSSWTKKQSRPTQTGLILTEINKSQAEKSELIKGGNAKLQRSFAWPPLVRDIALSFYWYHLTSKLYISDVFHTAALNHDGHFAELFYQIGKAIKLPNFLFTFKTKNMQIFEKFSAQYHFLHQLMPFLIVATKEIAK